MLVAISIAVLAGELALGGRGRAFRAGPGAKRMSSPVALGRARIPLVPGARGARRRRAGRARRARSSTGSLRGGSSTLPQTSILPALGHTALYSAAAAAIATLLAMPVCTLALRHRSRLTMLIERLAYLPMALPGLVVALGLVAFSVRYAFSLYQSSFELIVAYAILFLPLAVVGVRSAMAQASPRLEELGRSLGRQPGLGLRPRHAAADRARASAAAFALVFISSATELTATLLLRPTGVDTLATRFWTYTTNFSYGAAAPYAGLMVLISAVPALLLSRRVRVGGQRPGVSRLEVDGLWKGYGRQPVLRGVDLEVPAGSLTAVLGLSGCGKTTLLRVIAGFERAERGEMRLAGRTLDDGRSYVAPEKRGIGYVPQEGALFPHLDVAGNVGFGLSRAERRGGEVVPELLEMVGIAQLSQRLPHQLSGGEQQRVALARALARRPLALLLDEPFSSLDASMRTHVREEVHGPASRAGRHDRARHARPGGGAVARRQRRRAARREDRPAGRPGRSLPASRRRAARTLPRRGQRALRELPRTAPPRHRSGRCR